MTPAIDHPERIAPLMSENQTMNRHSYKADANRLAEQFPQHKNRKDDPIQGISSPGIKNPPFRTRLQERPIWLVIVVRIVAATSLNSCLLSELESLASMALQNADTKRARNTLTPVKN